MKYPDGYEVVCWAFELFYCADRTILREKLGYYYETVLNNNCLLMEEPSKSDYRYGCIALNEGEFMATPIRVVPRQQTIATTWPVMDRMLIFVSRSGVFTNGYRISPVRLAKGVGE
jgi:hypothetical protein